jgi:glycosyltransferase involved in cell wall biosynthesis
MEDGCKFAPVVPTLNEAANIELLLNKVVASLSQSSLAWEIRVVDDESSDQTQDRVKRFAEFEFRARLLVRSAQRDWQAPLPTAGHTLTRTCCA